MKAGKLIDKKYEVDISSPSFSKNFPSDSMASILLRHDNMRISNHEAILDN